LKVESQKEIFVASRKRVKLYFFDERSIFFDKYLSDSSILRNF